MTESLFDIQPKSTAHLSEQSVKTVISVECVVAAQTCRAVRELGANLTESPAKTLRASTGKK